MSEKLLNTMKIFDTYERRFAKARIDRPDNFSVDETHREKLLSATKNLIRFKDELVPTISDVKEIEKKQYDGYTATELRYQTWENCYCSATLTMPDGDKKVPLVFLFNGHTKGGRAAKNNQLLHHRLVKMGIAVMSPNNIGQGDRGFMGHLDAVAPFYCGLTLQGLILMESVAIIRYMQKHPRIDAEKIGACGNSGGGTLTLFLAALANELCCLCSTGYPSEFSYILSKEKCHCTCNLIPGSAYMDMWEIYGLFAPKPLLLSQGHFDDLIPIDLFHRNARKVKAIYSLLGAEESFDAKITNSKHPWNSDDKKMMAEFFGSVFGLSVVEFDENEFEIEVPKDVEMPENAVDVKGLCEQLTGVEIPDKLTLCDLFKPQTDGEFVRDVGRGDLNKVFAQMECALTKEW